MALEAVNQMVHYMAVWLFNTYNVLNIDCIVFSGGLLQMKANLIKSVINEFHSYKKSNFPVYFYETKLGSDSGLIGAVELLFD